MRVYEFYCILGLGVLACCWIPGHSLTSTGMSRRVWPQWSSSQVLHEVGVWPRKQWPVQMIYSSKVKIESFSFIPLLCVCQSDMWLNWNVTCWVKADSPALSGLNVIHDEGWRSKRWIMKRKILLMNKLSSVLINPLERHTILQRTSSMTPSCTCSIRILYLFQSCWYRILYFWMKAVLRIILLIELLLLFF